MFPVDVCATVGLNDRRFSDFPSFPLSPLGDLLSLGSDKGKEEKVKQDALTQAALAKEIDKLSARIRELREKETEARNKKLVGLANDFRRQWESLEPGYMLAYRKYCRSRPEVEDIPRSELWSTGVS